MVLVCLDIGFIVLYIKGITFAWQRPENSSSFKMTKCLFVCLCIATRAIFQLSVGCHHCRWQGCKFRPIFGTQGLWAGRDLYRATPTATRDLGLYGLIRKTGTHVPQWGSNPGRKDHQIFAPDALTKMKVKIVTWGYLWTDVVPVLNVWFIWNGIDNEHSSIS
jgi:hypothetical protein